MGLLDVKDPPTYSGKLEKFSPVMSTFERVLSLRGSKVVKDKEPRITLRFFGNHLLTHQGIPCAIKAGAIVVVAFSSYLIPYLVMSKFHKYRKDPFR